MQQDFDVIIIGSGIGGLLCGGILASKGLKVLIIERNVKPGGYISSFRRGGFVFDSAVDCISGVESHGLISSVLSSLGVDHDIKFVRIDPIRVSIFPDMDVPVDADIDKYIERLISLFPSESKGIRSLFDLLIRIFNSLQSVLKMDLNSEFDPQELVPQLLRLGNITYRKLLKEYISDEMLMAVLSDRCPFIGLSPSDVSALSMITLIMSYFMLGAYRPVGGFQRLANLLIKGIKDHGGTIITGNGASKIIIEGQNCREAICDNGERYTSRYFVSNADFYYTFKHLIGGEHISVAKKMLKNPGISTSFFIVYAGINGEIERDSSIGYFPSYDMERFFRPGVMFKRDGTIGITIASVEDRSRVPEGCHTIVLHEMVEASGKRLDKSECTEKILLKAEDIFPGLRERIVVIDSAAPQTLFRYTGNINGAAFGWRQIPGFRSLIRHGIKNLYIAGHWGDMGGGVLAAAFSGAKAAARILKREGVSVEI